MPPHLAQPCYVALGRALDSGHSIGKLTGESKYQGFIDALHVMGTPRSVRIYPQSQGFTHAREKYPVYIEAQSHWS